MFRLMYFIPTYFIFTFLVRLPLFLLGWILVPLAAILNAYYTRYDQNKAAKKEDPIVYHFIWPFMFLWDNYEDGVANNMYSRHSNMFLRICSWYNRNPVNNLRITPYLSCKVEPSKINFIGSFADSKDAPSNINEIWFKSHIMQYDTKVPQYFLCWQGLYSCFYWQFEMGGKLRRLWLGWKLYPTDIYGVTEYRKLGAGFATQFKRIK